MDSYNDKVIFYIPGAFTMPLELLNYIFTRAKSNPEIFKDNLTLGCVYGAPGTIWNGGRYVDGLASVTEINRYKDILKSWGVPIRFTFSNCLITKEHTKDLYANMLTDMFADGNNEIICNSPILEKYLRNKYGDKYKYISSTTKCLTSNNQINEAKSNKYFLTVLDIDNNKNFDLLSKIGDPSKVELLCNSACNDNCPRKAEHYKYISESQLQYGRDLEDAKAAFDCRWEWSPLYQRQVHNHFITPDDINNLYLPLGFKHFKLEGRCDNPYNWIETMIYFLIKEEYTMQCRQEMESCRLQ